MSRMFKLKNIDLPYSVIFRQKLMKVFSPMSLNNFSRKYKTVIYL